MLKRRIELYNVNDVKEFCRISSKQDFNIDVTKGRHVIDAKSLMGLFSLDLSKEATVVIYATDEEASAYVDAINKYVIK